VKKFISSLLILLSVCSSLDADTTKGKAIMGYLVDGINDIKYKDARVAFSLWTKDISMGENIDVHIEYFEDAEKTIKAYQNLAFEYLALNPIFYLQYQEVLDPISKEYWVIQKAQNRYEKMLLLVREESDIKNLNDLKSKSVMIRDDNYMGELFLDKEMLQEVHVSSKKHIKSLLKTKRHSTAILKTFFGKVDACIVPEYSFKLVSEMNPSISSKLVPLVISDAIFTPIMAIFHKNTQSWMIDAFKRNVESMDKTARGKSILELFKMKKIRQIDKEEMEPIKAYYSQYLSLQKKYVVDDE